MSGEFMEIDLSSKEIEDLLVFTIFLSRHAAQHLAENVLETEKPSENRRYYTEGLLMGSVLTPECVYAEANQWLTAAVSRAPQKQRPAFVTQLRDYYDYQKPLPSNYLTNAALMEEVRTWEALTDIDTFCDMFMKKTQWANDHRDIGLCLDNALQKHNIRRAYNAITLEVGGGDRDFLMVLDTPHQPRTTVWHFEILPKPSIS